MDFRLLSSSRVRTSGNGSSPVTEQTQGAMSLLSKEPAAFDAWNSSIFGQPDFPVKNF
jgi:hypothetical protein